MKIEELPSGSYRVRKTVKGKLYTLVFQEKPEEQDILIRLADYMRDLTAVSGSFQAYAMEYVKNRNSVLSPSSIRTYNRLIKALSKDFRETDIQDISQAMIQAEINDYAKDHAPKTVRSLHGFIASVLGVYRPNMTLRTTLPQKIIKDRYLPSESDIKSILDKAKGTCDSVAFQLGILSLRRSEICALELEDLKGNELHIHSNMVYNEENEWVKKESPKTDASNRIVYLPESLVEEIHEQGYFFKYTPPKLNEHLHKYQKELNLPEFRFHDLRHYFASYAVTVMPESDAMALGGWNSDHIFKQVYRESMKEKRKASAQKYLNGLF